MIKISASRKWIVSILELKIDGFRYKVTRRIPNLSVSETKLFKERRKAEKKFRDWLMH